MFSEKDFERLKMVMKRDITAMDDYVKSRPVPEKIWNKFLLTTNLVSFWNYVLPVLMLPVFIYFLPVGQVIASFFLFLAFSYIDGIYITCYRKATEWILKWPLILGWMGMFAVLIGYMFVASFFPVWMGWIGIVISQSFPQIFLAMSIITFVSSSENSAL